MDSISNQQAKYRFLVVAINDGSPDGSREILRKYERLANVIIIDQKNKGLSGARNTGLKHIRAKYVTFVDSDDRMMPGAIEAMMNAAVKYDADIVEGSYKTFYNNEEQNGCRHGYTVTDQWQGKLFGFPWGKVVRSTKFQSLCFPEGYWFEDTLFCFILYSMCNKRVTIPDDVYLYRINSKGITSTSHGNPNVIDSLLVTLQLLEDAQKLGLTRTGPLYDMFLRQVRMNYTVESAHSTTEPSTAMSLLPRAVLNISTSHMNIRRMHSFNLSSRHFASMTLESIGCCAASIRK